MKNIRRKITVSVLGTMLFVFASMLATVNIFIPEYLTSEAQKAILLEDERKDPIPLAETMDDGEEHFLTSSVRYLEVEDGLTESEHLSKAEYQLRKYCREEKPAADEFHTLKTGGSRFVFRISQVEADEYEDAYSYILYVDVGAVMQYSAYLNAVFFAVLAVLSVLVCLFGWKLGGYVEKAHESQKWFFQNVSHELKTPLMSISGYAEIIENNMVKPEDIPKFAGRIHSEASRLSSLVEDIIKLSRLDENDQSIPMEEVDLMQTCRDVEGHLSIRAKEQQVKMTLRGESCRIKGARQVLYEMIYNLCDNAIKYNRKDGEVEVTVSRGRNGRAVVSVADTGIGIAKEDQERIFERFYRVDKSHSRETGGTGLGLSIVKHGAILHDAKIKIESTLGTGTKIILEF